MPPHGFRRKCPLRNPPRNLRIQTIRGIIQPRARSSTGQSSRLRICRLWVQLPPGVLVGKVTERLKSRIPYSAEGWLSGSKRRFRKPFSRKGGTGSNPVPSALVRDKSPPAITTKHRRHLSFLFAKSFGQCFLLHPIVQVSRHCTP